MPRSDKDKGKDKGKLPREISRLIDDGNSVDDTDQDGLTPEEASGALEELVKEHATDDIKILVFQRTSSGKAVRIGEYNYPGEFDPDAISREFGGGYFAYTAKSSRGRIIKKWHCEYAIPRKPDTTMNPATALTDYNTKMVEFLQRQREEDARKADNNSSQMGEIFKSMTSMMQENFKTILTLVASKPATSGVDEMLKYKQIFGTTDPRDIATSALDFLKKGMDLQARVSGSQNESSSGNMLEQAVSTFMKILNERNNAAQGGSAGSTLPSLVNDLRSMVSVRKPVAVAPVAVPPKNDATEGNPPMEDGNMADTRDLVKESVYNLIRRNYRVIIQHAGNETPTKSAATFLNIALSHPDLDSFLLFFTSYARRNESSDIDDFYMMFPELSQYREWIDGVVNDLVILRAPVVPVAVPVSPAATPAPVPEPAADPVSDPEQPEPPASTDGSEPPVISEERH